MAWGAITSERVAKHGGGQQGTGETSGHGQVPMEGWSPIFAAAAFTRYRAEVMGEGLWWVRTKVRTQQGEYNPESAQKLP
ncbi:hypothetical protein G6F61_014575 [Rhizopus arrhizus]|nr:hypothetical protein G6F61_014575 [Rhizopus arrhizus]